MDDDKRSDEDLLRQIKALLVENNSRMVEVTRLFYEIEPNAFGPPTEGKSEAAIENLKTGKPTNRKAKKPDTLYCSFCGKSQHEVSKLIAGPTVFICDECVTLCMTIVEKPAD